MLAVGLWFDGGRQRAGEPAIAGPLLVTLFSLAALNELVAILTQAGLTAPRRMLLFLGFVMLAGKTCLGFRRDPRAGAWFVALIVGELVVLAWWLLRDRDLASGARRAAGSLLALVVVALLTSMIDVAYDWGTNTLFALVLTAKAGDSGAYLVGRGVGRHRLIEHVSPKKTIEGAVGGFAASLLVGWWLFKSYAASRWTTAEILLVAAAVNIAGQVGDLFESLWKRSAGVKDSGQLLPEFGGALDIVDSLFLAMPLGWALLAIFAG